MLYGEIIVRIGGDIMAKCGGGNKKKKGGR